MIEGFVIQDTLKQKVFVRQDTIKQFPDSSTHKNEASGDSAHRIESIHFKSVEIIQNTDTGSCCHRNSITDVTFNDSANIVTRIDESLLQNFPFVFTGINRKILEETKADLVKHLKSGDELPPDLLHNDWVLPVILLTVLIYGVIKAETFKFFRGVFKFISFRGINESASRDIGTLFNWQSTLFNLASFINISIFAFFSSLWNNILPSGWNGFIYWLIFFAIIISALTLRHFVCIITGNLSGEKEVFHEYLVVIYQVYRIAGLYLLAITVLILYTSLIPVNILFYAGFSLIALLYLIRVFRLFLIFINRHVSIFYLILYLCALEILPVVILLKYVTGLV
ncbi:MAG TPA: DUF4271 domain-containing protein [Ignavibacteria bacterium]